MLTENENPENLPGRDSGTSSDGKDQWIHLAENSSLNQRTIEELETLLEFASPQEIIRSLRDVLMIALDNEDYSRFCDFRRNSECFNFLFKFFDTLQDEIPCKGRDG
jgi:hypothetical protein